MGVVNILHVNEKGNVLKIQAVLEINKGIKQNKKLVNSQVNFNSVLLFYQDLTCVHVGSIVLSLCLSSKLT